MARARRGDTTRIFRVAHDGVEYMVISAPIETMHRAGLTPAEIEVARGIVRGGSNADIARERGTSVRTVANQVASILRKLGVASRLQIVAKLARVGARR